MKPLFALCVLLVSVSNAFAAPEIVSVQQLGQGQSLTGSALLTDSLYSNPAGSAFTTVYSAEATYYGQKSFGASIVDTRTSQMGGMVGYFRKAVDDSEEEYMQGIKLGFVGRLMPMLGLGVSGKILWGPGVDGSAANLKDLDTGVLANLGNIKVGAFVRNLFGGDAAVEQIQEWSLGGQINYNRILFFSLATHSEWNNFSPYQYSFGGEYISPYHFSIKAGYRIQPRYDRSYWGLGASFLGPKFSLHYSVEMANQEGEGMEHALAISVLM